MILPTDTPSLWPLLVYGAAALLVVVFMVTLSYFLGQRHQEEATGEPYESGIVSSGSARLRFAARFYLIAVFFLIFDLEAIYIFAWAVAARELGWAGYIQIVIFIGIMGAALVYLWRLGALDWGAEKRNLPATPTRLDKGGSPSALVVD
jgi:NADH-quinone oxidoreductase subunit A